MAHIQSVEDADYLRGQLASLGLVAFIGNNSVLPRTSGAQDTPMKLATHLPPPLQSSSSGSEGAASLLDGAIPFVSPTSMQVQVQLPHRGIVTGMGVSQGVTVKTMSICNAIRCNHSIGVFFCLNLFTVLAPSHTHCSSVLIISYC